MADESLNILLVERKNGAEKPILEILNRIQNIQLNVECADELADVSTMLEAGKFQLLMLDLSEENGGGAELLNGLIAAAPEMPLIVCTRSLADNAQYSSVVKSENCDFFIRESLSPESIVRSIQYLVARTQVRNLKAATENQAQVSRLIQTVTEALDARGSLQLMLHNCAQAIVDSLEASFARIWTFAPKEEMLVLQASAGLYTHIDEKHSRIPIGFSKIGGIAAERKPHLTNSVQTDPSVSDPDWADIEAMVSFAGYPLLVDDKLCGVVGIFSQHPMSDATLTGLSSVSTIIANAIERKRAEMESLSLLQRMESLLDANADAVALLSLDGIMTYVNPACVKIIGTARNELLGKCITEFVTDPERSMAALQKVVCEGTLHEFVAHVRTGSGKIIDCLINASVFWDQRGNIDGVIASIRDATQRLMEEEKLRNLASIFEHSNDAIITKSLEGIVTSWNKGAETIYGYSSAEIVGKSISQIIPAERYQEFLSVMEKLRNGELLDLIETRRVRKDGAEIDVSLSISPLRNALGEITGVSTIGRDISEKKRLRRELANRETLFREITTGALDAIICIDNSGKITVWNPAAEKIFGYRAEAMIGNEIHSVLAPPQLRGSFSPGMERFALTGKGPLVGKTVEVEAIREDGTMVPIELSISSFLLDNKWNAVGIARDISERLETQRRLKENEQALIMEHSETMDANKLLHQQAAVLQIHGSQMEYLTQLGEFLQVCANDEEAHEVIAKFGGMLFPESSGELYIFKESRNWVVRVAGWGEHVSHPSGFPVSECWALRRGQPHLYNEMMPGPRCPHTANNAVGCLCVPLVLMGEIFGIMHVQWTKPVNHEDEKLVTRLAADAALALTNLRLRKQLKDLSIRDPLTGLFNRRYLEEFFEQELIRSRRKSGQLSVIMIDIDHFKKFNDTFGHEAGDAVLYELGKFFKHEMRGSDVTCRYGGEEFILLLPETAVDAAQRRAEQLRKNVKSMQVKFLDNVLPEINLSLGVATFPDHGDCTEELIRKADTALYAAKEEGRDRVCLAPSTVVSTQ